MWRQWLRDLDLTVRDPATADAIAKAEHELGVRLPAQLRELYVETDGAHDRFQDAFVRPLTDLVRDTKQLWGIADAGYMAMHPHVFIGHERNGDEWFLRVLDGEADGEVFMWLHEDDSRENFAYSVRGYIEDRVERDRAADYEHDAPLDALLLLLADLATCTGDVATQFAAVAERLRNAPDDQRRSFAARAQGLAVSGVSDEKAVFLGQVSAQFGLFPDS